MGIYQIRLIKGIFLIYEYERNGSIEQGDVLKNLPRIPLNNLDNWNNYIKILNTPSEIPPPIELLGFYKLFNIFENR